MRLVQTGAIFVMALVLSAAGAAQAQMELKAPDALQWGDAPPKLPEGGKLAVLKGNPMAEGSFVLRLGLPADYAIAPHTHTTDENVTVIEGAVNLGTGETLDRATSTELPTGGYATIPAGHVHYEWNDDPAVVQIHGTGPFDIKYLDPANDPSQQKTN